MSESLLRIALSKGRILEETLPLLAAAGVRPCEAPELSRKLVLPTNRAEIELVVVRASDVSTYVAHGGADLGVAGKDVLMERGAYGLYEPLDLRIARCRLTVAGYADSPIGPRPRVATKFVNIARRHFAAQGRQARLIKLYGSMELAPLVGMSDLIVDLVDTGNTLRANGLEPLEHIADISARLVVNRASMKIKHHAIRPLLAALQAAVEAQVRG